MTIVHDELQEDVYAGHLCLCYSTLRPGQDTQLRSRMLRRLLQGGARPVPAAAHGSQRDGRRDPRQPACRSTASTTAESVGPSTLSPCWILLQSSMDRPPSPYSYDREWAVKIIAVCGESGSSSSRANSPSARGARRIAGEDLVARWLISITSSATFSASTPRRVADELRPSGVETDPEATQKAREGARDSRRR